MRILIVDDSHIIREAMVDILKEYGRCDLAPNGEIAVSLFEEAHKNGLAFDLVTMDIEMPNMNGQQAVNRIRAIEQSLNIAAEKAVKILMSTSRDELSMVSASYYEGCDGYINKPPTAEKIKQALNSLGIH